MKRADLLNGAGLLATLVAIVFAVSAVTGSAGSPRQSASAPSQYDADSSPQSAITDATGHPVDIGERRRVVAASTTAADILVTIYERDRLVGVPSASASHRTRAHLVAGLPTFEALSDLERIISLQPDLVVTNGHAAERDIARLRERGIDVFDLGPMAGAEAWLGDVTELARLLDVEERAVAVVDEFNAAMRPRDQTNMRALYIGVYGQSLYGGATGTSYHDVLIAAGLHDAAADAGYSDWPEYNAEEVLTMQPDLVVTADGMGRALCAHPGLHLLAACQTQRVIELPSELLHDPGIGMPDAARALRNRLQTHNTD